jgi:hypothetical protein
MPAKKRKARTRQKSPTPAQTAKREAEERRAGERLDLAAVAWVGAVRVRVRELIDATDRVTATFGHPDRVPAAKALGAVLDRGRLAELFESFEGAERILDELLDATDAAREIPDLAGAARDAGEALRVTA